MDRFSALLSKLEKSAGGEGSRGGSVIGHTRSGNPIYASSKHEGHQSFKAADHQDAMNHHYRIWSKANEKIASVRAQNPGWNPPKKIHDFLKHHFIQMRIHQSKMGRAQSTEASSKMAKSGTAQIPFYVAVIVTDAKKEKLLIGKRDEDGTWTSPGGGADVGELPKQAALRELFEEAGITVEESQLVELPMGYAHGNRPVFKFMTTLSPEQEKTITSAHDPDKEVAKWEWVSLKEELPEPMNDGRVQTFMAAKIKLARDEAHSTYGARFDAVADRISEQERQREEKLEIYRKFPSPSNSKEEQELNSLVETLSKAKALPVGTVRQWGPYKYVKHHDGWVVMGGQHHGKLMGDFKSEPKHSDFARHHESSSPKQDEPKKTSETPKEDEGRPSPEDVKRMTQELKDSRKKMSEEKKKKVDETASEMQKEEEEKQASDLGRKAYDSGLTAPIHDKELMKLFGDRKIGDNLHLFEAWSKGKQEAADEAAKKVLESPSPEPKSAKRPKTEEPKKEKPKVEPSATTSNEPDLTPEQEQYVKAHPFLVNEALETKAYTMSQSKFIEEQYKARRAALSKINNGDREMSPEERSRFEASLDAHMKRKSRTYTSEFKQLHRRVVTTAFKAGLRPSAEALADYPGLGDSSLPQEIVSSLNQRTNLIGSIEMGSTSKKLTEKFYEHLNTCNKLIDSMNIKFKTPLNFKAKGLATLGKRTRGVYINSAKVIELKDMSQANKTLMHEIGHALDYALQENQYGRGRQAELARGETDLARKFQELSQIVTTSEYYEDKETDATHKRYLRTPTEVFARAFEVYTLKKAEDLNLGQDFIDTFMPDIFKLRDPEILTLRDKIKDLTKQQIETSDPAKKTEILQEKDALKEQFNARAKETNGWIPVSEEKQKEYKMKISELMEQIIKDDAIKKALDESSLAITLQKSEPFEKAGQPIGSVRMWAGNKFIKQGDGHWIPLNEGTPSEKPSEEQQELKDENGEIIPWAEPEEEPAGPLDHLKPEKNGGGQVNLHSKDFEAAMKHGPFSIISAGVNSDSEEDRGMTNPRLSQRTKRLEQELQDASYKYAKLKGQYGGSSEAYLVFHGDEKHLNDLAKKFNQASVIHSKKGEHRMHHVSGENEGKHHKGKGYTEVPEAKDYFSSLNTSDGQQKKFNLTLDYGKYHEE